MSRIVVFLYYDDYDNDNDSVKCDVMLSWAADAGM